MTKYDHLLLALHRLVAVCYQYNITGKYNTTFGITSVNDYL